MWADTVMAFDQFCKEEGPKAKLEALLRTSNLISTTFELAHPKIGQKMTADDLQLILLYVVGQASQSERLYSHYLFTKIFNTEAKWGEYAN